MDAGLLLALVGIGGTLLGTGLGAGLKLWTDRLTERSRRAREDVVWRRENALTSAADFLAETHRVHVLARTVHDYHEALVKARDAGNVNAVQHAMGEITRHRTDLHRATEAADDALSRLSLLLSQEAFIAASRHLGSAQVRPHDPMTGANSAHLNNLLRADLGLPPRQIEGTGATKREYLEQVEKIRQGEPG